MADLGNIGKNIPIQTERTCFQDFSATIQPTGNITNIINGTPNGIILISNIFGIPAYRIKFNSIGEQTLYDLPEGRWYVKEQGNNVKSWYIDVYTNGTTYITEINPATCGVRISVT